MSEKIKNLPKQIYLQIGEDCDCRDWNEIYPSHEVSWCKDKINDNDIPYLLKEEGEIKESSFSVPNNLRVRSGALGSDDSVGQNGLFQFRFEGIEVSCIASNGMGWEHVSVSINRKRTPSWEIMNKVKDLFWGEDDLVVQYHPPKSEYVNNHPFVLHLWRKIDFKYPLPNKIMV